MLFFNQSTNLVHLMCLVFKFKMWYTLTWWSLLLWHKKSRKIPYHTFFQKIVLRKQNDFLCSLSHCRLLIVLLVDLRIYFSLLTLKKQRKYQLKNRETLRNNWDIMIAMNIIGYFMIYFFMLIYVMKFSFNEKIQWNEQIFQVYLNHFQVQIFQQEVFFLSL